MKRINLYLTESQILRFNRLSKQTGISVSEHIRRALDAYRAGAEEKPKEKK